MPCRRLAVKLSVCLVCGAAITWMLAWMLALMPHSRGQAVASATRVGGAGYKDWSVMWHAKHHAGTTSAFVISYSVSLEYGEPHRQEQPRMEEIFPNWAVPALQVYWSEWSDRLLVLEAYGWPQLTAYSITTPFHPNVELAPGDLSVSSWHIRRPWFSKPYPAVLPLHPIFPGFALNTLFYATILFSLFTTPPAIRRHLRRRRNHCLHCNYDLRGLTTCPECGFRQPQSGESM